MRPGKIVCVGRNYREHAKEMGNDVPKEPLIFLKPSTTLIRERRIHRVAAAVGERRIRRRDWCRHRSHAPPRSFTEARAGIGRIVAANDVTARDLQRSDSQWTRAKGFDTFCPIGEPATPPADLEGLTVVTRVNGVERQRAKASDMVFPIPDVLAYVSSVMTLEPGDLVLTGTPAGVGKLSPGDEVEVEVLGLSRVSNPVALDA